MLWWGQIISQFGDKLNQMALIALVYQRAPGSAMELAKIISWTIIPVFLIGPLAGVYVDRWPRRKTMFACDFIRAGLVLLIPLFLFVQRSILPIYVLIFLAFSVGRFFVPAKMSILPNLVERKELLLANSLITTTGMIAAALGFGLGGVLVDWLGARAGFYIDGLTFFVSAILIFCIRGITDKKVGKNIVELGRDVLETFKKSVFCEMKEGIFYLVKEKKLCYIIGILFLLWAALGSVYAVIIVFVQEALGSVTKDLGLLVVFLGAGLFSGSLAYGRLGQRVSLFKAIFMSLFGGGLTLVVFALALRGGADFWMAGGLAFILGLVIAPTISASNTLIHRVTHNEMRGKVFSSLEVMMHLPFLLSMMISASLADRLGAGNIIVGSGAALTVAGVVGLARIQDRRLF